MLVQCVILPGLDRESFRTAEDEIVGGGEMPAEIRFHFTGPIDDGWCVINGWTSKEARDRFLDARVRPAMQNAPLQGPPQMEDLMVEATMSERNRFDLAARPTYPRSTARLVMAGLSTRGAEQGS